MKRMLALAAVLVVAAAGLYYAERRRHSNAVNANALVDAAADLQRDVSRLPLRVTRLSDEQEIRIGDELANQYGALDSPNTPESSATQKYVIEVGDRLAARASRKLPYRFHLVPDKNLINAFALPGGHVFVGEGLLDQLTSEDELAFVLGHEIEHIDHYHAAERVQLSAQLKNLNLDVVAAIAQIPLSLWQVGYSKDEEMEADREGLRLAAASGYSVKGAVDLLERWTRLHSEYVIRAETPAEELSQLAVDSLTGYFRSHPLSSERLAQVKQVIPHDGLPLDKPLTQFRVEYETTAHEH
jgi:predicted Zn-dependent protease